VGNVGRHVTTKEASVIRSTLYALTEIKLATFVTY